MTAAVLIESVLGQFKHEVAMGLLVSIFLAAVSWPLRKAKREWFALTTTINDVHQELSTQRSNCLTTLQSQGNTQIELLTKVVDTLGNIQLDNREMLTHLREKGKAKR